ncbi:MAG: DUF1995 family protein [Geitlerinemataceae cyanobacterium]
MVELPQDITGAIVQAKAATIAAIADGYRLLQVELVFPELKAQPIAEQFLPVWEAIGAPPKVLFPDSGAAALARRDWGDVPFTISDLGSRSRSVETRLSPEDPWFVAIEPSAIEVTQVEQLYNYAGDRPVVLLLPRLEDVSTIGIGYAARQLRERFLDRIESCYYIQPLDGATLFRCYPSPWQVWRDTEDGTYELIWESADKPVGDGLERILSGEMDSPDSPDTESNRSTPTKKVGLLTGLQRFLNALNQ